MSEVYGRHESIKLLSRCLKAQTALELAASWTLKAFGVHAVLTHISGHEALECFQLNGFRVQDAQMEVAIWHCDSGSFRLCRV